MQKLPEPYQSLFDAMLWDSGAEAVPELVRNGADLSYCDPNMGRTALYAATIANRPRAVESLLQHGADPNQRFTYRSPVDGRIEADRVALHYAHSVEVAAALIKCWSRCERRRCCRHHAVDARRIPRPHCRCSGVTRSRRFSTGASAEAARTQVAHRTRVGGIQSRVLARSHLRQEP